MKTFLTNPAKNLGTIGVLTTSKKSLKLTYNILKVIFINLIIISFISINATDLFADGTRDFIKDSTVYNNGTSTNNQIGISLFDATNGDGKIATPEASDAKRKWYIRIDDTSDEVIYLGFNISKNGNGSTKYYRIIAPDGITVVKPWATIPTSTDSGYIESFYETFDGPSPTVISNGTNNTGGYTPIIVDVSNYSAGDFIIEFNDNAGSTVNYLDYTNWSSITIFKYFDISVGKKNSNTSGNLYDLQEGRFYAYIYALYNHFTTLGYNEVDIEYFAYQETDMVMSKLTWNRVVGGGWNILFNTNGAGNDGDLSVDRMSNPNTAPSATDALPQYKVFFAPPDTSVFPVLNLTPQFTYLDFRKDCLTGENAFFFEMNRSGTIEIILEFDSQYTNGEYEPNTTDRLLVFDDVTINTNKALWDGLDGEEYNRIYNNTNVSVASQGDRSSAGAIYSITFRYSIGVINNPIFDVERINGGLSVELYAPILTGWSVQRSVFWDDSKVIDNGYIGNFNYTGCTSGCHVYPYNPQSNSTSTPHPGNQIWMNSWWSSFDMITTSPFTGIEKVDTIPIIVNAIPTTDCDSIDGTLQIQGLVGNDAYQITYEFNNVTYGPTSYTADGNGEILIPGLDPGIYTNITVEQPNCVASQKASDEITCPYNIYGNVVNDASGVMENPLNPNPIYAYQYIDGPGISIANGKQLYVVLNEIIATTNIEYVDYQVVNVDGTYKFTDVEDSTDYEVILTDEELNTYTSVEFNTYDLYPSTPDQWYNIGEIHNNETNTIAGHDGLIDGKLELSHQLSAAQTNANFVNFAINDRNTLPIQLLSFNAYCDNMQISIKWETASEINNDFFTIEKSFNMQNWEVIDVIKGSGSSNQINAYSTIDEQSTQLVYYRLTQTDFDGKYVVYAPVSVDVCMDVTNNYSIDIYPNPSINSINVRINNYQYNNAILNVYNALGQNVYNTEMTNANIEIDVANWERGIYFTRINIDEEIKIIKIILQ